MAEERQREVKPVRMAWRGIFALGIGLGAAALWWEYSDQLLAKLLPLIGLSV